MYQPRAVNTSLTLRGILSINRLSTSCPISHHTSCKRCRSSTLTVSEDPLRLTVSGYLRNSSSFNSAHKCSIGFKSGEFGGHSIIFKPYFSASSPRNRFVLFAVCGFALSCWNSKLTSPSVFNASRNGIKCSFGHPLIDVPIYHAFNEYNWTQLIADKASPYHLRYTATMLHRWLYIFGSIFLSFVLSPKYPNRASILFLNYAFFRPYNSLKITRRPMSM